MGQVKSPVRTLLPFRGTFVGPDVVGLLAQLRRLGFGQASEPPSVTIDSGRELQASILDALKLAKQRIAANYEIHGNVITVDLSGSMVQVGVAEREVVATTLAHELATVPFEVASFWTIFGLRWGQVDDDDAYRAPSFSDGHLSLGWGAAFRGKGHDRLVSPNWLYGGPFKVWRHDDVSLVQFHALDADAATALEQAKLGHREIGITSDTGFLQHNFVYTLDLGGLYEPATRTMKVIVLGREIANREMLEWAAMRKLKPLPDRIVDTVAYVFPQEAEARANLHRLWRYGHQCWAIRGGQEVRLDLDYQPPDTTPSWAR